MMSEFKPKESSRTAITTIMTTIRNFARDQTEELMLAGEDADKATSIVANMMVREAWIIASIGVIAMGRKPNPDNFRAAVEDMLGTVSFKEDV